MLMRFDPFRELDSMAQMYSNRAAQSPYSMPMDAYRDGDRFVVHFDLPGVEPESIEVTVEKNSLRVQAERQREPREGQEVVVAERPQGRFVRQLFLGDSLDTDRIQARYDGGVLTITIPVAEKAKPRKIEVAGGETARAIPTEASERQPVGASSQS